MKKSKLRLLIYSITLIILIGLVFILLESTGKTNLISKILKSKESEQLEETITMEINTANDIINFNDTRGDYQLSQKVTINFGADINLNGREIEEPLRLGYYDQVNGNGHVIYNFTINLPNQNKVGLFDATTLNVDKLGIRNATITGKNYVGAFSGSAYTSKLNECYSAATVKGENCVGGLVADLNEGTINNCYNVGSVTGTYKIGGIAGQVPSGYIKNSYNAGTISGPGNMSLGGTIDVENQISNCYYLTGKGGDQTDYWGHEKLRNKSYRKPTKVI